MSDKEKPPPHLDVTGVCCPMPIIQLAKTIREMSAGQTLRVSGNDPIFERSIRDYCQSNGHTVITVTPMQARTISILIRVGG